MFHYHSSRKAWWLNGYCACAGIPIEQSGFERWPGHLVAFLGKTLNTQCASLHPRVSFKWVPVNVAFLIHVSPFFSLFRKVLNASPKLKHLNLTSCRGVPRNLKQWHSGAKLRNLATALEETGSGTYSERRESD